ncbi:MAG: hypothetical protein JW888_13215 [Pirellulales bacterium]|nr:hypothetical protein [Pirellulales bacterium]
MTGPYRKPQADIYTVLLALALAAVIVATIFAYLETADYKDNKYRGAPNVVYVDRSNLAPCPVVFDQAFLAGQPTRVT